MGLGGLQGFEDVFHALRINPYPAILNRNTHRI